MLEYSAFAAVLLSSVFALTLIGFVILLVLPVRQLVRLLESLFRFRQVSYDTDNVAIIDVCGDYFEVSKTLASRVPFAIAIVMCLMVAILLFTNACIFSARHIFATTLCSEQIPYCYLFKERYTSFIPYNHSECQPNKIVVPANMPTGYAQCYGFVLFNQNAADILEQIGICTSIQ